MAPAGPTTLHKLSEVIVLIQKMSGEIVPARPAYFPKYGISDVETLRYAGSASRRREFKPADFFDLLAPGATRTPSSDIAKPQSSRRRGKTITSSRS
jgi:hypothetical protein